MKPKRIVQLNRLEVIDHTPSGTGRDYIKWVEEDFYVQYQIQDEGRTIKIFLNPVAPTSNKRGQ